MVIPKLCMPSTLNINLILWHTKLRSWFKSWVISFTFQAYTLPHKLNCICVSLFDTLAVWTPQKFFPLLTRPQGSQGCQKITFFFLQMKLFSFCAKIASKRHKLQKPSKLKKKCQKKPVFLDIFEYSANWGQSQRAKPLVACL